jgi:uncharacterized protein (TIGR03435 family)
MFRMFRTPRFAAVPLAAFLAAPAFAQTSVAVSPKVPRFEVATIKPASEDEIKAGISGIKTGHGRAIGTNVTLKRCIIGAYGIGPNQVVGGPGWLDSDRFHIEAKAETPTDDDSAISLMMRSLLEERFHLVVRRETRTMQALVLEIGKRGPNLEKSPGGESKTDNGRGSLIVKNTTMDRFAEVLSRQTELPVVNRTALDGVYNLKLLWTPDNENPNRPDSPPSLFTAIQEQLGLRMQSQKAPVEVLVIDRAEKPTAN